MEQKEQLRAVIHGYMDIISQNDGDLGQTTLLQHSIHTSGATPIRSPPRRLPFHQRQETKQLVEDMQKLNQYPRGDPNLDSINTIHSPVTIDGKVQGHTTSILVDTGSALTLVREYLWANGSELQVMGETTAIPLLSEGCPLPHQS